MIVWIASYPKSGNTWIRSFISTYYLSNKDKFEFNLLQNIKQFPHEKFFNKKINNINSAINSWDAAQSNINNLNTFTFLKTHSALVKINNKPFTSSKHSIAGIYVVRDPRNIVTSISNHYQLSFEESLAFMTNNRKFLIKENNTNNFGSFTFLNSWSEHYKSWKKNKQFNLLFIKYEDLEKDTFNSFRNIVIYLNKVLKKDKEMDEERIKKIIKTISFEKLKRKEQKEGFPEAIINQKKQKKINFFYLGKNNKWEKILTRNQVDILNKTFKDDLKELKY